MRNYTGQVVCGGGRGGCVGVRRCVWVCVGGVGVRECGCVGVSI